MKLSVFLIFYLFFTNCKSSSYKGYVYDGISKRPLAGVQIKDLKSNHTSTTNHEGYFELKKTKDVSSILIFQKESYYSDTLSSIQIQNKETQKELFNRKKIYLLKKKSRDSIFKINK